MTRRNLQVPLPSGRTVALSQFATIEFDQELPLVWRRNRVPTLTVRADVNRGVLPETVVSELASAITSLNAGLRRPYRIETGGIVEETAALRASVAAVVLVMLLLMCTVLMFHLQSFQLTLLVLAVVPLGIIGVVAALLVFQRPLGFVAILGILSLLGMIAKNAVILLTQIEAERAEGKEVWEAVLDASSSRVRPILLTAGSTMLGLMPIAPSVFWGRWRSRSWAGCCSRRC
jgi:multidrug efflux pump subunit AcrB